ncbi:MAG: efflux RND transporter periplasmic adaptor subunit [Anaerolineae bacterium]|nr:efflux RND transporter periplasmic adaptor subunit [Anaerolineae bacterium]
MNKKKWIWISLAVIAVLIGVGYFLGPNLLSMTSGANAQGVQPEAPDLPTTIIRPATDNAQVDAAGNIEVVSQYSAMLRVAGIVTEVPVEVGDEVAIGDLLVAMDTVDLERAVKRAELTLASAQAQLDELLEAADPVDIASAQASLNSAREDLAEVQAGPSAEELAAAEATLAAAQERYQELVDGVSEEELIQLGVELQKMTLALQNAQDDYNRVAYKGDVGASAQATALQEATFDYEAAKAAYEEATKPASEADLQEALSSIQDAKHQLDTLRNQPTEAELASAEAQVASAEAQLADLLDGASESELQTAKINVAEAQLDLEEAQEDLARARLLSPIDGTVLAVDVEEGQKVTSDSLNAVTLTDLTELELNVIVAEVDIPKVRVDQRVEISLDALPGRTFNGTVSQIVPVSESDSGVVNYPVTIRLDEENLEGVLPGMTAVATIIDDTVEPGWLVPTTSVQEFEGENYVMVVRDGQRQRVQVTTGELQGEWMVVQSPDLKAGDEVVGQVTSFLDEDEGMPRGFMMGGGPPR